MEKAPADDTLSNEQNPSASLVEESIWNYFFSKKIVSFIVLIEAILSGVTDFMLKFIPIFFIFFNYDIKYIGVLYAVRRVADFLGAMLAPKITLKFQLFFPLDYIISGTCLLSLFLIKNIWIQLVCYFISFLVIGISGNIFEKMILNHFHYTKLASVYLLITTLYSIFGLIFLVIPLWVENVLYLSILLNGLTVVVGIILFLRYLFKEKETGEF